MLIFRIKKSSGDEIDFEKVYQREIRLKIEFIKEELMKMLANGLKFEVEVMKEKYINLNYYLVKKLSKLLSNLNI